jgi:hypothetical protein
MRSLACDCGSAPRGAFNVHDPSATRGAGHGCGPDLCKRGRDRPWPRLTCAEPGNVTEFPAGIGHNRGFLSVTSARRGAPDLEEEGGRPDGYRLRQPTQDRRRPHRR